MKAKIGFDCTRYVMIQSEAIEERIKLFDKLYLEIGGKLFADTHAARVLPGFKKDAKIKMFYKIKDVLEIIFCISAIDIEKNKTRGDFRIPYTQELLNLINMSKEEGFSVNSVVITLYKNQIYADEFIKKLNNEGIKTYIHKFLEGYPKNIDIIVSERGYGSNPFIETSKKLILVNAPGPGSGKLATCLSQIYHESLRNVKAGYAKFETFPVWNLPINHPLNLAYEAATADLKDVNKIDPFHKEKYGIDAVNYNRDIEAFPILSTIFIRISSKTKYNSPTDMGINKIGYCITDNDIVKEASLKEIERRFNDASNKLEKGLCDEATYEKLKYLKNKCSIIDSSGAKFLNCIGQPKNSETHSTYIITGNGKLNVKELKINLSCENKLLEDNWAKVCYIFLIIMLIFILFFPGGRGNVY
jgi:uncharacterized protein (UPF0371 family)